MLHWAPKQEEAGDNLKVVCPIYEGAWHGLVWLKCSGQAQAEWRLGLIPKTARSLWKVLERSCKCSIEGGVKLEERDQLNS